jgi:hypothetical protein
VTVNMSAQRDRNVWRQIGGADDVIRAASASYPRRQRPRSDNKPEQ